MEWRVLRDDLSRRATEVGDLLRTVVDGSTPVRGLDWSVGELGAHLASVPRRYLRMLETRMEFPASLRALNQADIDDIDLRDPLVLAGVLEDEVAGLLVELGDDGSQPVPFFGIEHTVAGVGGVLLGELCLHGLDLARTLDRRWAVTTAEALAVTDGLLPTLPYSVDREVAQRASGSYRLHLRGGDDWSFDVRGDEVTIVRGRPPRPDLTVSADPVAFVMVGYRRMPRARAVLTGRMAAWGRKPWLAGPFGRLFAES